MANQVQEIGLVQVTDRFCFINRGDALDGSEGTNQLKRLSQILLAIAKIGAHTEVDLMLFTHGAHIFPNLSQRICFERENEIGAGKNVFLKILQLNPSVKERGGGAAALKVT